MSRAEANGDSFGHNADPVSLRRLRSVNQGQVCATETRGDSEGWVFSAMHGQAWCERGGGFVGGHGKHQTRPPTPARAHGALGTVADTTNGALSLQVTGEVFKTITWTASALVSRVRP